VLSDADFGKLVEGKANAQKLFMSGKLKVRGDVMSVRSVSCIYGIKELTFGRRRNWSLCSKKRGQRRSCRLGTDERDTSPGVSSCGPSFS
jgi:hypothetical protein